VPEKKEVKGFHRHRRRLTTVNARHREEETEREFFETFRGNEDEDETEDDEGDSPCPAFINEPFHSREEPSDSRDDEGFVTMVYGDEEGEAEGEREPPIDIDVTAEGAGEEGDDVWYDVYDLRALGIQRDGESGDKETLEEGEGEGEAIGGSLEASAVADASDDIPPEMRDEEADADAEAQQSWRWDGYEETTFRDNYSADDRAEEFRDSDDDEDDSINGNDVGSGGGGGEGSRGWDRSGVSASVGFGVSATGEPTLARRTRVLSAYFSRLAKLSDQHPHRENIKFWAR
jgi:hypothetical protein